MDQIYKVLFAKYEQCWSIIKKAEKFEDAERKEYFLNDYIPIVVALDNIFAQVGIKPVIGYDDENNPQINWILPEHLKGGDLYAVS